MKVLLSVLVVASLASTGYALKCYSGIAKPAETAAPMATCTGDQNRCETKIEYDSNGITGYSLGCHATTDATVECSSTANTGPRTETCICSGELCNGPCGNFGVANSPMAPILMILPALLMGVIFKFDP